MSKQRDEKVAAIIAANLVTDDMAFDDMPSARKAGFLKAAKALRLAGHLKAERLSVTLPMPTIVENWSEGTDKRRQVVEVNGVSYYIKWRYNGIAGGDRLVARRLDTGSEVAESPKLSPLYRKLARLKP